MLKSMKKKVINNPTVQRKTKANYRNYSSYIFSVYTNKSSNTY